MKSIATMNIHEFMEHFNLQEISVIDFILYQEMLNERR